MTLDHLNCYEIFWIFCFPNKLFFLPSILRAIHSINICTVKIKIIRNIHAVLTTQIADILHFNDNELQSKYWNKIEKSSKIGQN